MVELHLKNNGMVMPKNGWNCFKWRIDPLQATPGQGIACLTTLLDIVKYSALNTEQAALSSHGYSIGDHTMIYK